MSQLKIPKGNADITREWIIEVTSSKLIPVEESITVEEIPSAGVMSNLLRIKFQTEQGTTESILLKLLPTNPFFLALNTDGGCDKREIKIYSDVIPQISQVLPELSKNFCTFYNGFSNGDSKTDYSSILVLEDLELAGYKNMDAESPNWMENLKKGLKFLGELHSFGVYLEEKHKKKIPEIYPFIHMPSEKLTQMALKWSGTFPPKLDELLQKYKGSEEIRLAYQKLNEKLEKVITKSFGKAMENPVLAHGDPWTSNILFDENDLDKPIKIIDFQFFGYRNPAWEHVKFILSALPNDHLNKENVTKAVHLYLKYFRESLESLGVKYEGSENDFFEFFNTWGMAFGYCWWLLGMGSFKDDEGRLVKIFEMIQKEYKVVEFLLNEF